MKLEQVQKKGESQLGMVSLSIMNFVVVFLVCFSRVFGQWQAHIIPMVPNSRNGENGFQFNEFNQNSNSWPENGYGFKNPSNLPQIPIQNDYSNNFSPQFSDSMPIQPQNFGFSSKFGQMSFIPMKRPVNSIPFQFQTSQMIHPRAGPRMYGISQFDPTTDFNQNQKSEQIQKKIYSDGTLPPFLDGADEITIKEVS